MSNWALPTATSTYVPDFLDEIKGRDVDAATMAESPTTPPTGYIRYNRTDNTFEEWDGAVWNVIPLDIIGGGTGATSSAGARTNLGIGSMGTQSASAVAITGGTIAGITSLSMSGPIIVAADDANDIGTNAARHRNVYIRSALVIPVGTDKYATS